MVGVAVARVAVADTPPVEPLRLWKPLRVEASMSDDVKAIERQLARLEAKALLHGNTAAIETEMTGLAERLDALEQGAGEEWLMKRDRELGRAFKRPA